MVRKILEPEMLVQFLKGLVDFMYSSNGRKGQNAVYHAEQHLQELKVQFP
jgi:hypothetical protein